MSTNIGPWLGQCHFVQNGLRREMLAAVWCRSHQEFDTILTEILTARQIEFLWSEEVHPAGPWVYTRPGRGGAELARTIHEGRRAAFGPAKTQKEAEEPPKDHLQITEIAGVIPLAFEVGNWDDRTVPEALEAPLFGQPDPTEAERATYGDAPLKTYAILDAAKMPYLLTSFLASSGLRHQSLFQGKTQEDLKEHAPYLVELEQENDLTQRLFTGPKGINGLWERELGIYVRSRAGFDDVRRHFRKFTRVQDENGKWFYFRFWEPKTPLAYFNFIKQRRDKIKYWIGGMIASIFVPQAQPDSVTEISFMDDGVKAEPFRFILEEDEKSALENSKLNWFKIKLRDYCKENIPTFAPLSDKDQMTVIGHLLEGAKKAELISEKAIANYAEACIRYGRLIDHNDEYREILIRPYQTEIERTELLLKIVKENNNGSN